MFIIIVFFIFTHKADANIVINEVQISPTEYRFIELYNNGSSSVDLTGWYIQRKTSTGTTYGSLVSKTYFEGKSITSNNFLVISKTAIEEADILYDGLTLTESNSLQIKNSNGDVVDKLGWGDSTDCGNICVVSPVEGKSIQRISDGSFIVSTHTPGTINTESFDSKDESNNNEADDSSSSASSGSNASSSNKEEEVEIFKITTKILSPKMVTAGVPFIIGHQTSGVRKENIILGRFVWNLGDGMSMDYSLSPDFEYIYQYPGDYVVTLSFYDSVFDIVPDATDKMIIKVIPSGLSISSVGTPLDSFIEIENNSNYEISLNDFTIKGVAHSFTIPRGMIVLPNKKLKLSPKITGFDYGDLSSVSIVDSMGQIFASYPKKNIPIYRYTATPSIVKSYSKSIAPVEDTMTEDSNVINLNELGANVGASNSSVILNRNFYIYLGLFIVITIGLVSVFLIRRKDQYKDYIERELTARDMTIIE